MGGNVDDVRPGEVRVAGIVQRVRKVAGEELDVPLPGRDRQRIISRIVGRPSTDWWLLPPMMALALRPTPVTLAPELSWTWPEMVAMAGRATKLSSLVWPGELVTLGKKFTT